VLIAPRPQIFRFYQVRKTFGLFREGGIFAELASSWGKHQRGASAVNLDGDVSLAGEEKPKFGSGKSTAQESGSAGKDTSGTVTKGGDAQVSTTSDHTGKKGTEEQAQQSSSSQGQGGTSASSDEEEEEEEDNDMIDGSVAVKFLLAGGIAGAVSRTATAPFDRLKVYLITASGTTATSEALKEGVVKGSISGTAGQTAKLATKGVGLISSAVTTLYREGGGIKAFWVGNGLNCIKIFPVSCASDLTSHHCCRN
jgi:solute carrier family 25 (mitochondrial phosphate transporter), member 23/24/25/41